MIDALIHAWHERELAAPYELKQGTRLVTGFPLWGEPFVSHFLAYCLPSMLAPVNKAALDGAGWELVLFVDGPTEERLKAANVPARLHRLPDDIVQGLQEQPAYKYPLLAAAHNLLIHKARDIGAGFHMMVADAIYSETYFARLLELAKEHDAIAHTGLAIVAETGLPILDRFRWSDGALVISARALGWVGWHHLNPQWASWTMDGIDRFIDMPNSHYIHWRGRDSVRIHCAHQSAAWIGNEQCQKVERGLGGTVDSELPRYLGDEFYAPRLDDEMVYIVIAGASAPTPRVPFADFKSEFWRFLGGTREGNRFLPYFTTPCPVPLPRDGNAPADAELDSLLKRLMAKLHE